MINKYVEARVHFFALLAVAGGLNAQTYEVHLTPPVRAGQVYAVSASGLSSQKASVADRVIAGDRISRDIRWTGSRPEC